MELVKRVYLASPYTHTSQQVMTQRFRLITKIAAKLFNQFGHAFYLPITQSHLMAKIGNIAPDWDVWKDVDLAWLGQCQELWVVMMQGWKQSKGVAAEIEYANANNIQIKFVTPYYFSDLTAY